MEFPTLLIAPAYKYELVAELRLIIEQKAEEIKKLKGQISKNSVTTQPIFIWATGHNLTQIKAKLTKNAIFCCVLFVK